MAEQGKFSGTGETLVKHVSADICVETARCFSESQNQQELLCYREVVGRTFIPRTGSHPCHTKYFEIYHQ